MSMNVAGTPSCMAPEQVLDIAAIDARTDVWGVGATLFRAISGAWPREFPEPCPSLAAAMRLRARPLESLAPHVPRALSFAIDVALSLDPSARWASARSLEQQLLSPDTRTSGRRGSGPAFSAAEERVQA